MPRFRAPLLAGAAALCAASHAILGLRAGWRPNDRLSVFADARSLSDET